MKWIFYAAAALLFSSLIFFLVCSYILQKARKERQAAQDAIIDYRLLFENATDMILLFRLDESIIEANKAALNAYRYSKDELLSKKISELFVETNSGLVSKSLNKPGLLFETIHVRKDGTTFPVEVSYQTSMLDGTQVGFTIIRDITERKQAEETINFLAYHDPLTGLPNRSLFNDRLVLEVAHAQREKNMLGVMFLDLDGFKEVNDTLGHAIGDQLLVDFAKRLKSCVRASDTVTRLGGDEFTLLLPDLKSKEDLALIAEKVIAALTVPWEIDWHQFSLTASVGIAVFPKDGFDAETLMKHADTAMYQAKEVGNNYQFYSDSGLN